MNNTTTTPPFIQDVFVSLQSACEVSELLKADHADTRMGVSHDSSLLSKREKAKRETRVDIFDFKRLSDITPINVAIHDVRLHLQFIHKEPLVFKALSHNTNPQKDRCAAVPEAAIQILNNELGNSI